ncbi:MAG: hypothetical protein EB012_12895 [Gammaproteobacteria bacterium]|nr:hypothetical protein [Gammaproteobacteria bacterium]
MGMSSFCRGRRFLLPEDGRAHEGSSRAKRFSDKITRYLSGRLETMIDLNQMRMARVLEIALKNLSETGCPQDPP